MTDQTHSDDAPVAPGAQPLWTRRKATAILVAAWAVPGLLGMAVMAGALRIAGSVFGQPALGGASHPYAEVLPAAATIAMNFLFWGIVAAIGASLQPKDDEVDYSEFNIASVGIRAFGVAVIAVAGLASVPMARQAGVHAAVALFGPVAMMFGGVAINALLGPKIRRRCPELWAEAQARRTPPRKAVAKSGKLRSLSAVVAVVTLLLFAVLFVVRAIYPG